MKLTNAKIMALTTAFTEAFSDDKRYLPAKINFYIQKNMQILTASVESITLNRNAIIEHYGVIDEETGCYNFSDENQMLANKELADLAGLEQDVTISMIPLSHFDGLEFTTKQMQALMFMIKDEVEE